MTPKLLLAALAFPWALIAQTPGDARGHWEGALEVPNRTLEIKVDIDKNGKGWVGSFSAPQNNATGIPLEVKFTEGKLNFKVMIGGESAPAYTGTLSADGKAFEGELTAGGNTMPLTLKRTGEAKVDLLKPSPALPKELEGKWYGTIDTGDKQLELELTIVNGTDGASAKLVSVSQGADIPVNAIELKEGKLTLKVNPIGGSYEGKVNNDSTLISGDWTQRGNTLPLNFKRK